MASKGTRRTPAFSRRDQRARDAGFASYWEQRKARAATGRTDVTHAEWSAFQAQQTQPARTRLTDQQRRNQRAQNLGYRNDYHRKQARKWARDNIGRMRHAFGDRPKWSEKNTLARMATFEEEQQDAQDSEFADPAPMVPDRARHNYVLFYH